MVSLSNHAWIWVRGPRCLLLAAVAQRWLESACWLRIAARLQRLMAESCLLVALSPTTDD
jgi:hypothetical protein